ncbi:hypothetical protein [Scytonema sp. UIC 10036]|uniref:hypothetical protein n=1 Tax=Scytonema sp. UIC 10036 TaxID=2304196 RepID=UPI00325C285A
MQIAGFSGQRVYLFSNYWGVQCSGIGAFYDDETSNFLETKKDILYTLVIGQSMKQSRNKEDEEKAFLPRG